MVDGDRTVWLHGFGWADRARRASMSVITVRSALDHHSGIPGDMFNGLFTANKPDPGYRAVLLKTLRDHYPERPVNTAWAYNNSGYVLLQNVVVGCDRPGLRRLRSHEPVHTDAHAEHDLR